MTKNIKLVKQQIRISHPLCTATILMQGAQLVSWCPKGEAEVLWSADNATYKQGKAFRGGIPICWPWFGKSKSPSHGFARIIPWELIHQKSHTEGVILKFTLSDTAKTRDIWPHHFKLILEMRLGSTCELNLQIDAPLKTTGALHTYLKTDNISQAFITGLGKHYLDTLQCVESCSADNDLIINKEVDRIYTLALSENKLINRDRTIHITHKNNSDVVVWNPWIKTSSQLEDMKQNDYKQMVCIETAKINTTFNNNDYLAVKIKLTNT